MMQTNAHCIWVIDDIKSHDYLLGKCLSVISGQFLSKAFEIKLFVFG